MLCLNQGMFSYKNIPLLKIKISHVSFYHSLIRIELLTLKYIILLISFVNLSISFHGEYKYLSNALFKSRYV